MKVLLLTDNLGAGGAERQFCLLAKSLTDYGVTVKVHSFSEGFYAQILRSQGIDLKITARSSQYDIRPARSISKIIREFQPDVVHTWGWMSTCAAFLQCKFRHIPLIGSARSGSVSSRKIRSLSQVILCDGVISNSLAGLEAYRVPKKKRHIVYNGFELDRIQNCVRNESPNLVVIMVATMREEKDWFCFVDAVRLLVSRQAVSNVRFVGVGDGPTRNMIVENAKDLIDGRHISFPGFLAEPMHEVAKADIGVLVSATNIQEGTSNSILEYMACGLPVVCSRSGGNLETVVDGETGILVEPGNAAELADAIEKLSVDRELAVSMGEKGKKRLEECYTVERMVEETISVYKSMLR